MATAWLLDFHSLLPLRIFKTPEIACQKSKRRVGAAQFVRKFSASCLSDRMLHVVASLAFLLRSLDHSVIGYVGLPTRCVINNLDMRSELIRLNRP